MGTRTFNGDTQKMKISISNENGMETFVEVLDQDRPKGYKYIKITSVFDKAKDPAAERVRYEMLMSPECIDKIKDLFKQL